MEGVKLKRLEYSIFAPFPEVFAATYLRSGGVSPPPYDSLSLSSSAGDTRENALHNLSLIQEDAGFTHSAFGHHQHGRQVECVSSPSWSLPCDGLLTQTPGLALISPHADCQVALLYDPVNRAIGAIHSGWRGSCLNIYQNAVSQMTHHFNTRPSDLHVALSPSLGPHHAEFINHATELPTHFLPYQVKPTYFDFWRIAEDQFLAAGVPASQIEIARICTFANPRDFFSHRRSRPTGRNATLIYLTK